MEDGIVVIQRQISQKGIQFLESVPDFRRVRFVGFLICPEELVQDSFTIWVSGIKGAGLQMVLEQIYD